MSDFAERIEDTQRHFTYADYKDWELDEGERYELLEGVPYAMSAPSDYHQAILGYMSNKIYNFLEGKPCKVRVAPYDVRLFYKETDDGEDLEEDDTVVQPDIVVICDEKKRGKEGGRGAPDMVIEIMSPSNTTSEMLKKYKLYQRAGVREFWVIYPEEKELETYYFDNGLAEDGENITEGKVPVAILPGLELDVEAIFNAT
jgi:Uma2 family endonuclease